MISTVLPAATLFRIPIPEIILKRGRTTMIYADHAATTKMSAEAMAAMDEFICNKIKSGQYISCRCAHQNQNCAGNH